MDMCLRAMVQSFGSSVLLRSSIRYRIRECFAAKLVKRQLSGEKGRLESTQYMKRGIDVFYLVCKRVVYR